MDILLMWVIHILYILLMIWIKLRVWERGAGETLACGSGACASAIIAHQYKGLANQINVHLKGGTLGITVQEQEVLMRGDTQKIFNGNYYK